MGRDRKSLVIVYQYGNELPQTAIAQENSSIDVTYVHSNEYVESTDPTKLTIVGAAYGLGNVTSKCQSLVTDNTLNVTANNDTFGDQWPGVHKSLVVVYRYGGNQPITTVTQESKQVDISKNPTATYPGLIDARNLLDDGNVIAINASNDEYVVCDAATSKLVASSDSIENCQLTVESKSFRAIISHQML